MRKIFLLLAVSFITLQAVAQNKSAVVAITASNIESVLSSNGDWKLIRATPNEKGIKIKSFTMKGAGYGEIEKIQADGSTKKIFCKIFGMNQNAICFGDADGERVIFKLIEMTSNTLRMSDGTTTVDFLRK
jgi:hypothetical protein